MLQAWGSWLLLLTEYLPNLFHPWGFFSSIQTQLGICVDFVAFHEYTVYWPLWSAFDFVTVAHSLYLYVYIDEYNNT